MQKEPKVERLVFDSYMAVIRNSVGTHMFKNFYAMVNGKRTDVMKDGWLSAAFHVSGILTMFKLCNGIHGTVEATVKDLKENGWKNIDILQVGAVVVWEGVDYDANGIKRNVKHIGFYAGSGEAISNDSWYKAPIVHEADFKGKRPIEQILWNPKINTKRYGRTKPNTAGMV